MRLCYRIGLMTIAAMMLTAGMAAAQCVTGTSVAELQTEGPFAGLYKYTVTITWDTPQGLSNVTMDCGFGDCPDEACDETFLFETVAGESDGEGGCTAEYTGEFNCNGNPSIGFDDPIVKWDAVGDCEPENMGTAVLCFYSNLGPSPQSQPPIILIKNGQAVCEGSITGDCPTPPCNVPNETTTWGKVKAQHAE